jgi:3-oxoacyl-(acyl-carrier-protein) synthase
MSGQARSFITRAGVLCAAAPDLPSLRSRLLQPTRPFHPVTIFEVPGAAASLPVAEVDNAWFERQEGLPRTHQLALAAARQAVGSGPKPDAIVIGTTTGGIDITEQVIKDASKDASRCLMHGLDTVGATLARAFGVKGPVITLSTACSSSAVALTVARELLRTGMAKRVLAGGADALCRLTLHGFRQLQLVALEGTMPLDANRAGMTVGEGAAFVMLESEPQGEVLAELAGCGLSCDAFHATRPHPEGLGAWMAMQGALQDAAAEPGSIDYINLHGTGTVDNDAAEVLAVRKLFADEVPALSSTKGMTGHPLAAAGAIECVISLLAMSGGILPANVGLRDIDPKMGVEPLREPGRARVRAVLSNSFGFGGNNASIVLRRGDAPSPNPQSSIPNPPGLPWLRVTASQCFTAKGDADATCAALAAGEIVAGMTPDAAFAQGAPPAMTRRLKRLPKMILALAAQVHAKSGHDEAPSLISIGTAWGPLAETQDFLRKHFETQEQFSSPTDFVGSVHNAPGGQVALLLKAHAPNLTCSSGDRSFEHALLQASLLLRSGSALIMAAEAWQPELSPLLDPATEATGLASDGGAGLWVETGDGPGAAIRFAGEEGGGDADAIGRLLSRLGGMDSIAETYDAIWVGVPAREGEVAQEQLQRIRDLAEPTIPVMIYRDKLGQHASVSATAAVTAIHAVHSGVSPLGGAHLTKKRLLLVNLGAWTTALEIRA